MDKSRSWEVVDEQRAALADLLASLTPQEWATPSLCEGWTVRDVGAHLALAATAGTGEVLGGLVRARGGFDRMIREVSLERGRREPERIVADLRGIVGSRRLAPGTFWRDPLLDLVVHGQDLARPVGRVVEPPADAVGEALEWTWRRRFPFFPARRLRGLRLVAEDLAWSRGSGQEVRGPALSLLLLSTGRSAGVADLGRPEADLLAGRF